MEKRTGNTPADVVSKNIEEVNSQKEKIRGIKRPLDSEVLRMIQEAEPDADNCTTIVAISIAHPIFNLTKRRLMGTLDAAAELSYGEAIGKRLANARISKIPIAAIVKGQIMASKIINDYIQSSLDKQ